MEPTKTISLDKIKSILQTLRQLSDQKTQSDFTLLNQDEKIGCGFAVHNIEHEIARQQAREALSAIPPEFGRCPKCKQHRRLYYRVVDGENEFMGGCECESNQPWVQTAEAAVFNLLLFHHEEENRVPVMQRLHNQKTFIESYMRCLDGIPEIKNMPGSLMDGYRDAKSIRHIVLTLLKHCNVTWEHDCCGTPKTMSDGMGNKL